MKYREYAQHINANEWLIKWIGTTLAKHLTKNTPSTEEVEHIIDYLAQSGKKVSKMSYIQAHALADKWTKAQQKKGNNIEERPEDTEVVLDFKDGFKVVKLVGENAYKREGYLMSHCVGGYYGNGKEVYSLRDKNNIPHCTIEKNQQIKGKGNGDITPKYIDYIVRFLEHTGMQVRDSEMAHLGYEVVKFAKYAKIKCYRDRYAPKGTKIEYKDNVKIFTDFDAMFAYTGKGVVLLDGSVSLTKKTKCSKLEQVSGYVYVSKNATFTAPKLEQVSGCVDVSKNATFTAPKLEQVSGYVEVNANTTFTAPKLKVSGYVYVSKNATFTAPKLEQVSGYVDVSKNATFTAPKLKASGSVYVNANATFTAPKLKVSGYVYVSKNATFTAPKLEQVSGYVEVKENATFTAPKLEQVSGYVDVSKNATFTAPKLKES